MDALDTRNTYEHCLGTVVSWKGGAGYIDWFTEEDMTIKIKFLSNERHVTDKQHVHFSALYNSSTNQWIAMNVTPASFIEGIVYSSADKNLVIKYGKRQTHYRILHGDHVLRSIRVRPGDRVKFLPACSVFSVPSYYFAAKPDLLAHGVIDCVVQDHGKDTGVYIKWRVCEDVNGERPSEERIFHMFRVNGESKFLRPGLKVMLTPVLLIKKTTGRLNLTSVFGSLICFAEAIITELPTTISKRGSHMLPGKARLVAPHHGMIVEFYKENVETPDSPRTLKQGDKVQIQMRGDIETSNIDITLALVIEGTIVNINGQLEISETSNGVERRWRIDPDKEEAVLGYLPLQEGDLVRCTINSNNFAESVRVLSEVEGKVPAQNLLLLRNSVVAVFKPKNPRAFKVGDMVMAHLEWSETHYRGLDARVQTSSPILTRAQSLDTAHSLESPRISASPTHGRSTIGISSPKSSSSSPGHSSIPSPTIQSSTVNHMSSFVPQLSLGSANTALSNSTTMASSSSPMPAPNASKSPPISPTPSSPAAQIMGEQDLDRLVDAIAKMEATQLGNMMEDVDDNDALTEYDEVVPPASLNNRPMTLFRSTSTPAPTSQPVEYDPTYEHRTPTDMFPTSAPLTNHGYQYLPTPPMPRTPASSLRANSPPFAPRERVAASPSPLPFSTPFTTSAWGSQPVNSYSPTFNPSGYSNIDNTRVDWGSSTLFLNQYYMGQQTDVASYDQAFSPSMGHQYPQASATTFVDRS